MMKRGKSNSSKGDAEERYQGSQSEADRMHKDVRVKGEILFEPTPKEALARKSDTEQRDTREKKRWWLEVSSFFVLTLYAGLTFWQGCNTQRIADQFAADQRAWIGITDVSTPPELTNGTVLNPSISIVNSGKTPASNVIQRAGYQILPASEVFDPRTYIGALTPRNEGVIVPGGKRNVGIDSLGQINQQRADELSSGKFRLYLYGIITYADQFGTIRHTRFAMRMELSKPYSFAPYGDYDYED